MGRKTVFNQAWDSPGVAGRIAHSTRAAASTTPLSLMGKALHLNSLDADQANRYYQLEIEPALEAHPDEGTREVVRQLCQNTLNDLQTLSQAELSEACSFYAANPDLMLLLGDPTGYNLVQLFCQLNRPSPDTIRTVYKAYFNRFITPLFPRDLAVSTEQTFKIALHQHQHLLNPMLVKAILRLPQLLKLESRLTLFIALYPKVKSTVPSLREVQLAQKRRPVSILRSPSFAMAVLYCLPLTLRLLR